MKQIKSIRLTKEHFDSLDEDKMEQQYILPCGCPVFKACQSVGINVSGVGAYDISVNGCCIPFKERDGYMTNIVRIAKHLKNGGKYGIVRFQQPINI